MSAFKRRVARGGSARLHMRTVRDLLRYACTRFEAAGLAYGHGLDNAFDEASRLILWALHLPPEPLEPWLDARLTTGEIEMIVELVEVRCADRAPLAYLTGEAWLRGLRFYADPRALVPRSLLAEAIEEALPAWLDTLEYPPHWPASILDLCTGGASIAIIAALAFAEARIDASDLSSEALQLAGRNIALHDLDGRIHLHEGDLFAALPGRRFELIVCNPPYVNTASMERLPEEYRAEPAVALAGGNDGMDLIRRIIAEAPAHLEAEGVLILEIGHEATHFEAAFGHLEFGWLPVSAGDHMVVIATREQLAAHQ